MMQSESTPYGITQVRAPEVSDNLVSNRKVCIIDSGYDINHPDLQSTRVAGYTGTEVGLPWNADGDGHGTHVAGTVAALGNNGQGVVGVVPNGQLNLHIVRVFDAQGNYVWRSSLVTAVQACVDAGSNIVSMSLGGGGASTFEAAAYKRVTEDDGVLLIAAAGNDGNASFSYPASYSYVMSVAANDRNEGHATFSQFNSQVSISGSGVSVQSTTPNGNYAFFSGTSMATPHVSGVAALVWSHFDSLTGEQIRKALEQNAKDKGTSGFDNFYGHGLVDAKATFDALSAGNIPGVCTDSVEGWHDSDGTEFNCAWYSIGSNCAQHGDSFVNDGFTANQACCGCGGGTTSNDGGPTRAPTAPGSPTRAPTPAPTPDPTPSPTRSPTAAPTASDDDVSGGLCQDSAGRFSIENGRTKNCKWASLSNTDKRCNRGDTAASCPVTCGADCACFDTEGSFTINGKERDCEWVARKLLRCDKNIPRSNCPLTCGVC